MVPPRVDQVTYSRVIPANLALNIQGAIEAILRDAAQGKLDGWQVGPETGEVVVTITAVPMFPDSEVAE